MSGPLGAPLPKWHSKDSLDTVDAMVKGRQERRLCSFNFTHYGWTRYEKGMVPNTQPFLGGVGYPVVQ